MTKTASAKGGKTSPGKAPALKTKFMKEIAPALKEKLGVKNLNAVPKIKYVKINVGIGSYVTAGKDYEEVVQNIAIISGQKPLVIKAKKAISNFKLKIGMPTGVTVTLRGKRMYDFITKLIDVVFPRIRDFRGLSKKSFDGRGNYSVGIKEHFVFPEISAEDVNKVHGVQVVIVTNAKNDKHGYELLKALGFPLKA